MGVELFDPTVTTSIIYDFYVDDLGDILTHDDGVYGVVQLPEGLAQMRKTNQKGKQSTLF